MINLRTSLPLAAALFFAFCATAPADVGPPVSVELLGTFRAARAGETYAGQLKIVSGVPAVVGSFTAAGPGWGLVRIAAPPADLAAGQAVTVDFAAFCQDPRQPLIISYQWNGMALREVLDLSPRAEILARQPVALTTIPGREDDATPATDLALPQPSVSGREPQDVEEASGRERVSVRVRGRFVYSRPDGVVIGVDGLTARIYDSDVGIDDHLFDVVTAWDGRFDVTFTFNDDWEDYPDIYVEFESVNSKGEIEHPTSGAIYSWETGIYEDVTNLNLGTLRTADESVEPALHLLTDTTRTWRWFHDEGYDPHYVEVEWPDGDEGAWYTDYSGEIHISSEHEWSDQVLSHEYGHHFLHCYAPTPSPDYCNGICDEYPGWPFACGHCVWCQEDADIAWSEGFPNYLAYVIPDGYLASYGIAAVDRMNVGDIDPCSGSDYDPPETTEGYIAAALVDIHDAETGENHPEYPNRLDRLNMGPEEILACVNEEEPTTAMGFLREFLDRYPSLHEQIWDTAANCGFELDEENPAAPSAIYSASHNAGVASPDPTVEMTWVTPVDDASGANAYSYTFRAGSPALPDTNPDILDQNACTSSILAPGTYYFCIRARDRAGNWSAGYGNWGPIVIRELEPSNLTEYARAGWDFTLVPSSANTNTVGSTHVSTTLPGGTAGTYWNVSGQNDGESATSTGVSGRVYSDDVLRGTNTLGTINAHSNFYRCNSGPVTVPGGRHTLHYRFDALDAIFETDETDNTMGHQFIWTPTMLDAGVVQSEPSQAHTLAGWENVHDGSILYYNCCGLRFDNSGWWNAAVVWAHENTDNYDLRLHNVSTGAQNGFGGNLAYSSRGAGYLDAVIVNANTVTTSQFDAGVIFPGTNVDLGFDALHVENRAAIFDAPVTRTLGPDRWLEIFEFNVTTEHVGPVSAIVRTEPPTANVHVQWRGEDFTTGRLSDCDGETVTGADGTVILQFEVPDTGYNTVCVFRDPSDGDADAAVTLEIRETPPDLTPYLAAGWHSPLVPRPAADGTPSSVALPDTLHGNMNLTYHNLALRNLSSADAESVRAYIWLDGQSHAALLYPLFTGGGTSRFNYSFPYVVGGGRHTLSLNIDPYNRIEELSEDNNVYGEQYVWSPLAVAQGATATRVAPPELLGGWSYVTSGEPRFYDCDGLRMSSLTGWWAAMAVMPGDTSNIDVRLHQPLVGVKNGFAGNLAYSSWSAGASDYVLVNFNLTTRKPYDAGILRTYGTQAYTAECVREAFLGDLPEGTYGPFTLPAGSILRLHEMRLNPGSYRIQLDSTAGNVNWGLSLHPHDETYLKKSTVIPGGTAWMNGAGQDEEFTVTLTEEGYYCLAVWKKGTTDLPLAGQYRLTIEGGLTPVGDELPAQTRLAGIYPNPFNPRTTIAFELAVPAPVRLTIHDLAGACVRELVNEARPAGRQEVVWDGRDGAGRRAASGSYIARLIAGDVVEARKLVMVK